MIKLARAEKPDFLTAEKENELIRAYSESKGSVWNKRLIKEKLLESSYGKCAYCECKLDEESKYMEIDHFKCKDIYPDMVVNWENLVPSCKRCNGVKSNHDVVEKPIINPYENTPSDHMEIYNMRFQPKDDVGRETINVLSLNDHERAICPRAKLVFYIDREISEMLDLIREYESSLDASKWRKISVGLRGMLVECQKDREYSFFTSCTVVKNSEFKEIVAILMRLEKWNGEIFELYRECAQYQ